MAVKPTSLTDEEIKQGYRVIPITFKGKPYNTYHCNECQYDSMYLNEPNPALPGSGKRMGIIPHMKKGRHPWAFENPELAVDAETEVTNG